MESHQHSGRWLKIVIDIKFNKRSLNYIQQLKGTIIYRVIGVIITFFTVPLLLTHLGNEHFGIWATILGVFSWMLLFDLGIGNGLRNKVAELIAKDSGEDSNSYISTAYIIVALVACIIFILIFTTSYFINWQRVFNTSTIGSLDLARTIRVTAFFMSINFILNLVINLLGAVQKTSVIALGQLSGSASILMILVLIPYYGKLDLTDMAYIFGISTVVINLLLSFYFYRKYPTFLPKNNFIYSGARYLTNVGSQFFIIQMALLIITLTDRILIIQLFGAASVTPYEVVFKYFNIVMSAHSIISTPLWSAYTDAYHREDYSWIRRMIKIQIWIFIIFVVGVLLMIIFSKPIINLWIGNTLNIPPSLPIFMGIYFLTSIWNNIFAMFINGTGRIKLQTITALLSIVINIPLTLYLWKNTGLGVSGIVVASTLSLLLAAIALPIQTYYLLKRNSI